MGQKWLLVQRGALVLCKAELAALATRACSCSSLFAGLVACYLCRETICSKVSVSSVLGKEFWLWRTGSHRVIRVGKELSDPQIQPQPTVPTALSATSHGSGTPPWTVKTELKHHFYSLNFLLFK